jgi:ADP-ribose pyrophosphatase YjhB (NUDIX family)
MIKCILESGRETSFRHVVVGTIVINEKQEVLLVKRSSNLLRGDLYTIPGGFLDRDETLEEGALRELKEETGYEGKIEVLFQITDSLDESKEDRQNVGFVFIAKVIGGKITLNSEITTIQWFAKDNLPSEEDFAFYYRPIILHYFEYLKKSFILPIVGQANS